MKKNIKRIFALVIAMLLLLGMTSALAGTISVQNVIDNETYTAYKILNYTKDDDREAVSYYLTASEYASIGSVLEAAGFEFTESSDGTQYFVSNAEDLNDSGVSEIAAYLGEHTSDLGDALGKYTATGANGEANFTNLPTGYFFVTSTVGTLCALHADTDIATAVEKNTIPTVDKTEKVAEEDEYVNGPLDANIGDTVYYKIVVTDGVGTDAELTLTDTMSDGLDYKAGTIKIDGTEVADDADVADNYKVTVDGRTWKIVFAPAYVAALGTGETITVTYEATINANAIIDKPTNENKIELDYSAQHSEDKVYVATYDFQLYKTDGSEFLDGAGFKLYDAETGGNLITVGKDTKGYYVDATSDEEILVDSANGVNVRGLAPGIYYLEETTVPDGYNKLDKREAVTITTGATAAVEITVVNNAGAELPSTGGMGTTIFYVIGGLLVLAAAIILISRRRVQQ